MQITVVIINGLGGVGKSTFVNECKQLMNDSVLDKTAFVKELSTVDYVKHIAKYCGWTGGKTTKDRQFLKDLKTALERWNNSPIDHVFDSISFFEASEYRCGESFWGQIFFVNSREAEDIVAIKEAALEKGYRCIKLLVENASVESNEIEQLRDTIFQTEYDYQAKLDWSKGTEYTTSVAKQFLEWVIQHG